MPNLLTAAAPSSLEAAKTLEHLLRQTRSALALGQLEVALDCAQAALQLAPTDAFALQVGWQASMAARRWDWALQLGERWRAVEPRTLSAYQACLLPLLLLHRSEAFASALLGARFAFGRHGLLNTLEALFLALLGDHARSAAVAAECNRTEFELYAKALLGDALVALLANGWQSPLVQAFLLYEQQQACVWTGRAAMANTLKALQGTSKPEQIAWQPLRFAAMGYTATEDVQIALANRLADAWPAQGPVRPAAPANRRLKIAYLSARLGAHATVVLMGCVPNEQDHSRFEIYAYGFSPLPAQSAAQPTHTELHIQGCDHLRHLPADAAAAAAVIAADGIDVLLVMPDWDMNYLAAVCRASGVPVIISYMSLCVSTGGLAHYRIVDDSYVASDPPAREAAIAMRGTYYTYSAAASGTPSRHAQGLPQAALVMAAFNAAYKISPELAQVWVDLLKQVPTSVLWLHQTHPLQAVQLQAWFAARGIASERLVFAHDAPHTEHLARCALADVYLDAWDIGGHTSVLDALYASVPVVTLEGTRIAQRIGANLLRQHGAQQWIASNAAQYQQLALELLQSVNTRQTYRELLQRSRAQFAPFNLAHQARRLDAAITAAYAQYAQALAPADIIID